MLLLLRISEKNTTHFNKTLYFCCLNQGLWHTFVWQRICNDNCCHAWGCFHTALLLLVASSELLSIQLQKACKTLSSSKSQTFFFPSPLFSPSFIFVGFSNIKLSPDFQTGWKIRVSPACKLIQRARSSDVPPCSVVVAVQEQDHSDMLMDQQGSSKRGLPRFKRQLPTPFLFMPYSQPASLSHSTLIAGWNLITIKFQLIRQIEQLAGCM